MTQGRAAEGITHLTDVATYAFDVITLFGLALAVDYSLLMVNRFREARAAARTSPARSSTPPARPGGPSPSPR